MNSPVSALLHPRPATAPADRPVAVIQHPAESGAASKRSWVPVRSLAARHRGRIVAHLVSLDDRSRYLRFGYVASDEQLMRYAERIDFDNDEVFGIFNRRLELIAMAHLAHQSSDSTTNAHAMSEFGVSVLHHARRRGFGSRLFEHAMLHARNRHVDTLFVHALSENTAMLKIARNAGATVERDGPESQAWLRLLPDSIASHLDALIGERAAEFDYRLKVHAHVPSPSGDSAPSSARPSSASVD